MANNFVRLGTRARRRARRQKQIKIGIIALAALIVLLALFLILRPGGDRKADAPVSAPAPEVQGGDSAMSGGAEADEPTPAPTAAPTPEPTPAPTAATQTVADPERAATRPTAVPGFLPVFNKAETEEKIIAITVDDCFQADNLQQIVDKAIECGAKLTIFPIGKNAIKAQQSATLKYAWENGFELENHTYTHNGLYACTDEELAQEVYMQQLTLCYVTGTEYQPHFLRPRGGDARADQRIHAYIGQLGYYGVAHWSVSGSHNEKDIAKGLKPGAIFLFHTTNTDLEKLLKFIPWVAEQGYQMVTLNEMFGYPDNETAPLLTAIQDHEIPPLEPYERVYTTMKKTTYSYAAWLLQEKLIQLGYLTGEPDGVYGGDCEKAVKKYQKDHGLEETGVATPELQEMIFSE